MEQDALTTSLLIRCNEQQGFLVQSMLCWEHCGAEKQTLPKNIVFCRLYLMGSKSRKESAEINSLLGRNFEEFGLNLESNIIYKHWCIMHT